MERWSLQQLGSVGNPRVQVDWCGIGPVHWVDQVSGNGYAISTYVWLLFCPESGHTSALCMVPRMGLEVEDTVGHVDGGQL